MANYIAAARSNYFRVNDEAAFEAALEGLEVELIRDSAGRVGLISTQADDAGWPSSVYDEETGEHEEIYVPGIVSEHLADDEVAVFIEVGHEKMVYLSGFALAINNQGETREVSLSAIYPLARELGQSVTEAEY
jgi:hypothetical protein